MPSADSDRSNAETGPGTGFALLDSAARDVGQMVATSRRAVAELTANAEALGRIASRRSATERDGLVAELARTVALRAEGLCREVEQLSGLLERARKQVSRARSTPAPGSNGPSREGGSRQDLGAASHGARLLVSRLALAGVPREEIEKRLQTEFGIGDPGPLLAEMIGPERSRRSG